VSKEPQPNIVTLRQYKNQKNWLVLQTQIFNESIEKSLGNKRRSSSMQFSKTDFIHICSRGSPRQVHLQAKQGEGLGEIHLDVLQAQLAMRL
jgi:hypothetical protein